MTRASVSVRYTVDNDWIVVKGNPTTGARGRPMPEQFRAHAQILIDEQGFGNLNGCWGDQRIEQIAAGESRPGSRTTWVEIGVNRHLSLVANRLN